MSELKQVREQHSRFERATTLAREQASEQASHLAAAILANGDAIGEVRAMALTTRDTVVGLDAFLRARFEEEDREKGKLLAELATLHEADGHAEARDATVDTEITSMRRAQASALADQQAALAAIERDRAQKNVRQGAALALGGAFVSWLKTHPDALERFGHWITTLLPGK
jgi:hypothetical protein